MIFKFLVAISTSIALANSVAIKFYGIKECKEPIESEATVESEYDEENQSLSAVLTLPFDIAGSDTFHMDIHEYEDGEWEYFTKTTDGEICDYVQKYLPKAWKKIRELADPQIEDECNLEKGAYTWTDFTLTPDDVSVPPGMGGRYKLDINLIQNEEEVLCVGIDLEILKN